MKRMQIARIAIMGSDIAGGQVYRDLDRPVFWRRLSLLN
jgi:hypothetical protein